MSGYEYVRDHTIRFWDVIAGPTARRTIKHVLLFTGLAIAAHVIAHLMFTAMILVLHFGFYSLTAGSVMVSAVSLSAALGIGYAGFRILMAITAMGFEIARAWFVTVMEEDRAKAEARSQTQSEKHSTENIYQAKARAWRQDQPSQGSANPGDPEPAPAM